MMRVLIVVAMIWSLTIGTAHADPAEYVVAPNSIRRSINSVPIPLILVEEHGVDMRHGEIVFRYGADDPEEVLRDAFPDYVVRRHGRMYSVMEEQHVPLIDSIIIPASESVVAATLHEAISTRLDSYNKANSEVVLTNAMVNALILNVMSHSIVGHAGDEVFLLDLLALLDKSVPRFNYLITVRPVDQAWRAKLNFAEVPNKGQAISINIGSAHFGYRREMDRLDAYSLRHYGYTGKADFFDFRDDPIALRDALLGSDRERHDSALVFMTVYPDAVASLSRAVYEMPFGPRQAALYSYRRHSIGKRFSSDEYDGEMAQLVLESQADDFEPAHLARVVEYLAFVREQRAPEAFLHALDMDIPYANNDVDALVRTAVLLSEEDRLQPVITEAAPLRSLMLESARDGSRLEQLRAAFLPSRSD